MGDLKKINVSEKKQIKIIYTVLYILCLKHTILSTYINSNTLLKFI